MIYHNDSRSYHILILWLLTHPLIETREVSGNWPHAVTFNQSFHEKKTTDTVWNRIHNHETNTKWYISNWKINKYVKFIGSKHTELCVTGTFYSYAASENFFKVLPNY